MKCVAELKSWLTNVVEPNLADLYYATLFASFRNLRWSKLCMKVRDINKVHDEESMIQGTQAAATAWLFRLLERKEGAFLFELRYSAMSRPTETTYFSVLLLC